MQSTPTARMHSVITGKKMEKPEWGPNWEDILGGEYERRKKDYNFKDIEEKTKKRSQLKNILLLLSRILLVSAVVLAFCFPFKENNETNNYKNLNKIGMSQVLIKYLKR